MSRESKHVVVIGAGVVGLCTAYYCAQRGLRVTVIDRDAEERDGCSFGNAGMITPSHFVPLAAPGMMALGLKWMWNPESPFYVKPRLDTELFGWGLKFWRAANTEHVKKSAPVLRDLNLASRECFEELAVLPNNDFGLVTRGLLMLCRTERAFEHERAFARQANELGMPAEVLDAKQTAALEPNITMDIAGSVYFPKDCHLSPRRFMDGLKQHCNKMGVKFLWGAEVTGFTHHASRITSINTSTSQITGDEVVLAAGSWSPFVARELGLKIPMQAGKGYSLTLTKPRQLPQLCSICTEARVAVTPMGSSLRFGGTMEIAGLNEDINPVRVRGIIKAVPKYFPKFTPDDFADVKPWCGLRPCSPDGLPYVGRAQGFDNLSIATGHAMMGLSLGPITGKLISQIISDEPPSIAISMLTPNRYA